MITNTNGLVSMSPEDAASVFERWMRASILEMVASEAGDEELAESYFQMRKGDLWKYAKFAVSAGMRVEKMAKPQHEKLAELKKEFGVDKTLAAFLWVCQVAEKDYPLD